MSKLPQRQQQNYQSGSPSISDKESNDSHQLLLAHLYNYFRSNGLNDSAEALLRECNNSIPKSANGMFSLGNSDLQTDNTFLDEWWSLLWSLQSSVHQNPNPMGSQQRMLTPQQQMILQQRMFQQQQQQQQQLQQQRLQQQALIQQQQQQRIIASRQQQQQQQQQQQPVQQQQNVLMQAPIPSSSSLASSSQHLPSQQVPPQQQQHTGHAMGIPHSSGSSNPYFPNSLGISTPTAMGQVGTPGGIVPPAVATPTSNMPGNGGAGAVGGQQPMYPLQYHLYAPAPPPRLTIPLQPHELNSQAMFISNELREYLHKKNEASLQTLSHLNLPEHVNQYHSLVPIDKSYEPISKLWMGKNSLIFKVYSNYDGNLYVLRKIEPCNEIVNDKPFGTIKKWKSIKNANIVGLQDAFTTMAFNNSQNTNNSLCIIYDYYPNSVSLLEQHKKGLRVEPITEDLLWCYLIQLINAITVIHQNGLTARSTIDLSKIIVTNKHRIRLGSVGISDILEYNEENEVDIKEYQVQDIKNISNVLVELSVLLLPVNMRQSANIYNSLKSSTKLSEEFVNILQELHDSDETFDLEEFSKKLSGKMLTVINNLEDSNDFMESQLGSELENARLFRLMTKLNYLIYDDSDKTGVATGNNKILRLFLNYLYNSYDSSNNKNKKVLNLNKVLINLNKLDCGIDEKLLLINKDECIIISYKELKEIIDNKFRLMRE